MWSYKMDSTIGKQTVFNLLAVIATLGLTGMPYVMSGNNEDINFITHHGYYDDGTISEDVEYNTSASKPKFELVGRGFFEEASKAAHRIGKALHILPAQKETSGLDTNMTFFSGIVSNFKKHLRVIYPGTQWCGDGDRAKSFDDLGRFEKTDNCCRGHDKCPIAISPKGTKFGLENTGLFTRSHCDCDTDFYQCLKNSSTLISKKIGFTYFTVLGPQCFKEEYPIIGCIQYIKGKCVKYHLDPSGQKKYQWFDNEPF